MKDAEALTILILGVIVAVAGVAGLLYPLVEKVTNFMVF